MSQQLAEALVARAIEEAALHVANAQRRTADESARRAEVFEAAFAKLQTALAHKASDAQPLLDAVATAAQGLIEARRRPTRVDVFWRDDDPERIDHLIVTPQ